MAHAELEHLYLAMIPAVRHALEGHGGLRPFAAALGTDGRVARIEPRDGTHDGSPAAHLRAVHGAVQAYAAAEHVRAVCVCTAVTLEADDVGEAPDGVRVHLEHVDGESVDVLLPYRAGTDGVEYGEAVAQEAGRRLL